MIALWLALSMFAHTEVKSIPAIRNNNAGVKHLEKDEAFLAYKEFLQGLKHDPLNPKIHLNLGLAYEKNKEPELAIKEYVTAAQLAKDPEDQFAGLFNAANVLGQNGKIPDALALYQRALELKPDSVEVKTNIELLWKGQGQGQGQGGGGSGQDKNDQQGGGQDQSQNQNPNSGQQEQKQPKPFDSKELTKGDVKKILEELKNQEQQIRARIYNEKVKTKPNEKDW